MGEITNGPFGWLQTLGSLTKALSGNEAENEENIYYWQHWLAVVAGSSIYQIYLSNIFINGVPGVGGVPHPEARRDLSEGGLRVALSCADIFINIVVILFSQQLEEWFQVLDLFLLGTVGRDPRHLPGLR